MNRSGRWLALGLCCLLCMAEASRVRAQQTAPAPEPSTTPAGAAAGGEPGAATNEPKDNPRKPPQRVSGAVTNEPPQHKLRLIPPFMKDERGDVTTTALFPFYFERKAPESRERLVLPYYYRRGKKLNADVALGLVWSLRGPDRNTFVLPPFYTHHDGKDWAFGIPPLVMTGIFNGHHHTIVPPLLTWIDGEGKKLHKIVGPFFDFRDERGEFWGLFPFLWKKQDDVDRFTLVPPFFFQFADDDPLKYTTVVPPFYHLRRPDQTSWGLVPLVFRKETPELKSTTVPFALFHYASGPNDFRLVTPLLAYLDSKKDGRTWVTPIYQRKRGDKNLDAVAPFYFRTWDNRDASRGLVIPPIYWHWDDPANDSTVVFPFVGRWYREGISSTWVTPLVGHSKSLERDEQTWWVAPTFHYARTEDSWQFNIHPLFYLKDSPQAWHLAVAPFWFDFRNYENKTHRRAFFPLYWDFANFAKQKRSLVVFPLWWEFHNDRRQRTRKVGFPLHWDFTDKREQKRTVITFPVLWRFQRGPRTRTVALNTFYEETQEPTGESWQYHFFPFTSFGRTERANVTTDKWWNVLYGLAGYEQRGKYRRMKLFYIPIRLRDK